ncbi:MAG TPA: DUF4118 domain-containing protein [Propionibacteriaceae bacterium]|nr:DUF4118 domain-containing protein [Propionibacteriaceae bacterium]
MPRGSLRIYLGAAPGVGKTVAMLDEGRRRRERGQDVVIGFLETHGRAFTAQAADGLEVVPRRTVVYRGTRMEEMDTAAIVAREPALVLVDELAHTNAPGSAHEKRWQDVEDLREAGINVISTVNIQHLESLNDAVQNITGTTQRETVPDDVVRSADQIELVDMTPEALRRRLAHGHVYPLDRVDAALGNYFRPGNLSALRELALVWLADRVEETITSYREEKGIATAWPTRERVLVALTDGSDAPRLLRRGARIASRGVGGELHAVYVASADGLRAASITGMVAQRLLTSELGGHYHTVSADDTAAAVVQTAQALNASQIVVGAARGGWWRRALGPGLARRIIATAGDIDVLVIPQARSDERPRRLTEGAGPHVLGWLLAIVLPAVVTGLLLALPTRPTLTIPLMVYLLTTVMVSLVGDFVAAIVCAVGSSLIVNWFFTAPLGTFTIAEPDNAVALVVYVVVAVIVAGIVNRIRTRTTQALEAQRVSATLVELSHALLQSTAQLRLLLERATEMLRAQGAGLVVETPGGGVEVVEATDDFLWPSPGGAETIEPVSDRHRLIIQNPSLTPSSVELVAVFAAHAAAILTRRELAAAARSAEVLERDNKARTALLSAVSHDLRTPLTGIKAAVTSLRSGDVTLSPDDQAELLATIDQSSDRLERLITNLLDMSRISAGATTVRPQAVDIAESVDSAVMALPDADRVSVAGTSALALADPVLLDRVIANLVENALVHTGSRVTVDTGSGAGDALIRVIDHGPGVPAGDREAIFRPFQRQGDIGAVDGVGLGLAVARGLAEAMSGAVTAEDTPGGGLTMTIRLPLAEAGQ